MSLRSDLSLGVLFRDVVRNLASTLRRMRDEQWESGWGCYFWGRNDTHLAGDEAKLARRAVLDEGESVAECPRVVELRIDDDCACL